jgi:serine/threonine protein kinase
MKEGDRVLSYIVDRELGEGGMGTVFLGRHTVLNQQVAIKALSPLLSRDQALRERFIQEANIQAGLRHQGIVQVLTAEMEGEQPSLVMEYIDGKSLSEVLELRGALPIGDALKIMEQVLSAVGYAHRQGVIHRDLKPSNVMVMANGEAKVTDFGIAKVLGSTKLTRTGTAMGSAHYMSPEQIRRPEAVDARSDIYSLGCVFYEVLTGRPPFGDKDTSGTESDYEVKTAHVTEAAPALETVNSGIPAWLAKLVMSMLEKEPDQRPSNCEEIVEALKGRDKLGKTQIIEEAEKPDWEKTERDKTQKQEDSLKTGETGSADTKTDKASIKVSNKATLIIVSLIVTVASIFFFRNEKPATDEQVASPLEPSTPPNEKSDKSITSQIEQMKLKIEAGNPNNLTPCPKDQNAQFDNCWGTITFPGNSKYVGEFKDNKKSGHGTYTLPDGAIYVGEFEDDKIKGQGSYTWPDGSMYVGEFKDDNFNGQGTFNWPDGSIYVGEFRDDKKTGQGTYNWPDGFKYVGEFKDDKKSGQGTFTWPNGSKYVGEFKGDKFHGKGIYYRANGSVAASGIYQNDSLIKSEYVDPDSFTRIAK